MASVPGTFTSKNSTSEPALVLIFHAKSMKWCDIGACQCHFVVDSVTHGLAVELAHRVLRTAFATSVPFSVDPAVE